MSAILTSDRVNLYPMAQHHIADLHDIYRDPRAMKFMPTEPHTTREQTTKLFTPHIQDTDSHYWVITLHGEHRVIGLVNFLSGTRIPGMGYILHPDYWGRGIITEACRIVIAYGFESLVYDRIELWIDEDNHASLHVADKLGFNVKGRLMMKYAYRKASHYMQVWGLKADEWSNQQQHSTSDTVRFLAMEPVLYVRDISQATQYYHQKLGFNVDYIFGDPPNHAGVSRGEWSANMVTIQLSQFPPPHSIQPSANVHIRITGITAFYQQCLANNVTIVSNLENKPWGFREFVIKDLDGHSIIFAELL